MRGEGAIRGQRSGRATRGDRGRLGGGGAGRPRVRGGDKEAGGGTLSGITLNIVT